MHVHMSYGMNDVI